MFNSCIWPSTGPLNRMKKSTSLIVMAATGLVTALLGSPSAQAAEVGVSISVSQPGVYGRIDIGQYPQPAVVVQQPVLIRPAPVYQAPPQPVYLWVPPGHRKNWRHHCQRYNACGVPVYFVRQDWYHQHVAPAPRPHGGPPPGRGWDRERGEQGDHGEHGRGRGREH